MAGFEKITKQSLESLKNALGEGRVLTGDAIGADYKHDETPGAGSFDCEAVCVVETTEQISAVLKICNENKIPVTPRGAGTGMVGGSVPLMGGIVLETNAMKEIIGIDEETMTVKVQPGVLLSDLKAAVQESGFCYPPDPGEKTATIGGNVATNAGGPSAVKYGVTRDYVVGATAVLPTGEVLELGGAVGKNSSGYSLLNLLVGSEGTLAVISQLTLKLLPKAGADVSLIMPFMDGESCVKAAGMIIRAGFAPSALEYIDTDIVELSGKITGNPVFPVDMDGNRVGASLLLTLEGKDDDDLDAKMEAIAELSEEFEPLDILVVDTPTLKRDVWAAHAAFHTSIEGAVKRSTEINAAVPVTAMSEYVDYIKQLGSGAGLGVYAYGHAGDGGLHIYVGNDSSPEDFAAAATALMNAAYAKCKELGGTVSSEHGIGNAKQSYLKESLGEDGYLLLGRIKAAFDPNGILNPGKICSAV